MTVIERHLDEAEALDDAGGLAERDEPPDGFLEETALLEPQIHNPSVLCRLDRQEEVLDPDVVENLDPHCDSFVERCLDRDCLVMPQVLVVGEADEEVLPGERLLWLVFLQFAILLFTAGVGGFRCSSTSSRWRSRAGWLSTRGVGLASAISWDWQLLSRTTW